MGRTNAKLCAGPGDLRLAGAVVLLLLGVGASEQGKYAPSVVAENPAPAAKAFLAEDFDGTWKEGRWRLWPGSEFPGAKGEFTRSPDAAHAGKWGGKLSFDFSGGGNYVAAVLSTPERMEYSGVRLWVRKPRGHSVKFRYTDQTAQTLQVGFDAPDEQWAEVEIPFTQWEGHWGGANDGTCHGPPASIAFLIENGESEKGALLIDDVRFVDVVVPKAEYVAAKFGGEEGWRAVSGGAADATRLEGRTWSFDFTKGASWVAVVPPARSLLGTPSELRIRVRGRAPGHPVRLQMATHFQVFERVIGEFTGDGESELVTPAPPGAGWRWFGGENDGALHGPLRVARISLEAQDRRDTGQLELIDLRVTALCPQTKSCTMYAAFRQKDNTGDFVATARNLLPAPVDATLHWVMRDWNGKQIADGGRTVTVPAAAEPLEVAVPMPPGEFEFLETEFHLDAPGLTVPDAPACYTAPIEPAGDPRPDPSSPFGMGVYLYRYPKTPDGLKEMDRAAKLAEDIGVKWSREEFNWARIEREKGRYDWSFYDAVVAAAKRHGISIYGLLAYWSTWTRPYTAEGIEDYCRFVAATVERYHADVHHWEVWNEPNIFFWQGPRQMYAELLKKAYVAIKKADPDAQVLGCSTAGLDRNFIRQMIQLEAPFDVLTIHPYRRALVDSTFINELKQTGELAKRPDGSTRPVWITEMGWATYVPHNTMKGDFAVTTERRQTELIARAYVDAMVSGATSNVSWYDFRNDGEDPYECEFNMGIVTRDFRIKPACRAFATVTRMLKGRRLDKDLSRPGVMAFRFVAADGSPPVTVLWSLAQDTTVDLDAAGTMLLTNLMGQTDRRTGVNGKVSAPARSGVAAFLTPAP